MWFLIGLIVGSVIIIVVELISKHRNKKRLNSIEKENIEKGE